MATPVSVRLPDDLRERVRELASADRRSLGSMVVVLLEEAIMRRGAVGDQAVTGSAPETPSEAPAARHVSASAVPVRPPAVPGKRTFRPDPKR